MDTTKIEAGAFIENDGYIAIEAPHFSKSTKTDAAEYKTIDKFGKTLGGVKAFPTTNKFGVDEEAPVIEYSVYVKEKGNYILELFTAPNNPVIYKGKMCVGVGVNGEEYQVVNTIPDKGYIPWISADWAEGVLSHIHKIQTGITLKQGANKIAIKAMDPAVVLQKLVLAKEGIKVPESYLGPKESCRK